MKWPTGVFLKIEVYTDCFFILTKFLHTLLYIRWFPTSQLIETIHNLLRIFLQFVLIIEMQIIYFFLNHLWILNQKKVHMNHSLDLPPPCGLTWTIWKPPTSYWSTWLMNDSQGLWTYRYFL